MTVAPSRAGFAPVELSEPERDLVRLVREFARTREFPPSAASPTRGGFDREFSAELARRGWVGMTIPSSYGGSERTGVERCLVISELLAAGAPLGAHWTADRQTAPSLLINGPETLRRALLPRIAAGNCLMAGGFSEPDAGSDLAAVRTRARKVDGGWRISGRKIWTTDAERADFIEVLCRTEDTPRKHDGLSLIVVPMDAEGIQVSPIEGMDGERHFNEVVLDDVFAPEDWLIGTPGHGWRQLTAELALERAGPERYLTTMPLFEAFVRSRPQSADPSAAWELIGDVVAEQMGLREMSLSIARLVDDGGSPVAEAAMAKDLGTEFEQLLVDQLWEYRSEPLDAGPAPDRFHEFLDINRLRSAVFTTAGGTNEVLRMLVGRELRGWAAAQHSRLLADDIVATVHEQARAVVDRGHVSVPRGEVDPASVELLEALRSGGFLGVSVPERFGGADGSLDDALDVLVGAAYAGVSVPLVEGPIAAGWLLARAGLEHDWSRGLAVWAGTVTVDRAGGTISGAPRDVRWGSSAHALVTTYIDQGRLVVAMLPGTEAASAAGDLAGEPVVRGVAFSGVRPLTFGAVSGDPDQIMAELELRTALGRAVSLSAALQRCAEISIAHAHQREQFGQPIARFQAVQAHLARLASAAQRVAVLVDAARSRAADGDLAGARWVVIASRVLAGRAAGAAARAAHQVHGAIGVTMEYPLQRFTRRLYEWPARDVATAVWARRLGEAACAEDIGSWRLITGIE